MGFIIFLFVNAGGFSEIDFFFQTTNGISVAEPFAYIIYYVVILLVVFYL